MVIEKTFTLPSAKPNSRIGILGGSFDPPHLCHQLLALSFLALEEINQLWVVPCADHAFKNDLSPFEHRLAMCREAFQKVNNAYVLDIEAKLAKPSYTVETLTQIKNLRPDLSLVFGLGSDLVANFERWHRAKDINTLASLVIFKRENYALSQIPPILNSASIHQGYVLPDTSSTNLRDILRSDRTEDARSLLDHDVFTYVKLHGLYH